MKSSHIFVLKVLININLVMSDFCSPFLSKNCKCSETWIDSYSMRCPAIEPSVMIDTFTEDKSIYMKCNNRTNALVDILPDVNFITEHFEIFYCMLEIPIFENVLKKFHIINLKILNIEDCDLGNKSSSQIDSTFLGGINTVLERLTIRKVNKTFAKNVFEGFPNLEQLFLTETSLKNLSDGTLKGLRSLKQLKLTHNIITNIEKNTFSHLNELDYVDLESNRLGSIPDYAFANLEKLAELNLENNNLETIFEHTFENCTHLVSLSFRNNKLKNLLPKLFKTLQQLNKLYLSNNSIERLPDEIFHKLTNLKDLSLLDNKLSQIKANYFKGLRSLVKLDIACNFINSIEENAFANLVNLKEIYLNNNNLNTIPGHTFENCTRLFFLNLQNNKFKKLPSKLIQTLQNLKTLHLDNNELSFFPNNFFLFSENLVNLTLENNQLSKINNNTFYKLKSLQFLNLRGNMISFIYPEAFNRLKDLTTLDLSHNQWTDDRNGQLWSSPSIEKINLSHNNASIFPSRKIGGLPPVFFKEFDFSYNSLSEINVTSLHWFSVYNVTINLRHNNISNINFTGAEDLVGNFNKSKKESAVNSIEVYVSNNPLICDCSNIELIEYFAGKLRYDLKSVINIRKENVTCSAPKAFKDILISDLSPLQITCEYNHNCPSKCACIRRPYDNTVIVNCSYRNLTNLPSLKIEKQKLEIIAVGNSLKRGPQEGEGYENVTILNLSNNKLMSFDWCPPLIEKVNLSHNSLQTLSRDVLNSFELSKNLSQLILGQNPWTCACETLEFQKFILKHSQQFNIDTDNLKCEVDNIALIDKELCISGLILAIQITTPILSIFLLTSIAIGFYFRYKQEIKIWLYSKNWCLWFVTEEELDKDKKYDIFLSFSHKDEDFVIQNLLPPLEKTFTLCIHSRDWMPGELINDQIVDSVCNSRRTLVVLSNEFLESTWGKFEFLLAHKQSIEEGRPRVIVIKLGNLNVDKMSDEFKAYMKTNTYVEWGEPWFWKKLLYSLPHPHITKTNKKYQNTVL